jgi:hypothetical protein
MVKQFPLQAFFKECQAAWADLPDHRKPSPNTKYALSDAVNSAMSLFFMQSQSFLAHHQAMSGKRQGKQNLQTLFEVKETPSDNQIRNLVDPLEPTEFAPQYEWIWQQLSRLGGLKAYQTSLGTRLIALDGMVYHSSTEISCACCSTRQDRTGKIHYYHATLLPLMVQPGLEHVLTCFPEMITPQDGAEKQDCERNAGKRWLNRWSHLFAPQSITYLGDDLFCNQPFCEAVIAHKQHFIFVCKPDSHVELYRWLAALTPEERTQRRWNGKHGEIWRWQWVNQLPLRAGDDALLVNWCDLQVTHEESGDILYHNSWATNHELQAHLVEDVCTFGRTRWKIENEGINVLKRKGYHVEHNFGHGSQHLAQVFLVLNLLAFLLHTAMHLVDDLYQFLRQALHTRIIFFNDLRALCRYHAFPNWDALWFFMIKSLDEDDVPPNIAALISN